MVEIIQVTILFSFLSSFAFSNNSIREFLHCMGSIQFIRFYLFISFHFLFNFESGWQSDHGHAITKD